MPATESEALAGLRVLVAVAGADGRIAPEERKSLDEAFAGVSLPKGVSLDGLLAEAIDVDAEVKNISDAAARDSIYNAAYILAYADGKPSDGEQKVLDRVREGLKVPKDRATFLGRVIGEAKDTILPSNISPASDPSKREAEVKEDVLKYSIFTAILGAFPVPGVAIATDLAVVGLQVKMVRDVGQYWGHKVDDKTAKSLVYGLGLGTGTRIAVTQVAKLIPVYGSAFGAAAAFGSTWALGKVADQYFAGGGKADISTLRDAFRSAQKEGRQEYESRKKEVEARKSAAYTALERLNSDLRAGKMSQPEYARQVSELA
jgi:uncharacterized protein (DUF697 family)/uncharacterized tellurite resistance protein B-like protein